MNGEGKLQQRLGAAALKTMRGGERRIVGFTAYTAAMARAADRHADLLFVGDSMAATQAAGLALRGRMAFDRLSECAGEVVAASRRAMVVVDLPFAGDAAVPSGVKLTTALQLMRSTGCQAVIVDARCPFGVFARTTALFAQAGVPMVCRVGTRLIRGQDDAIIRRLLMAQAGEAQTRGALAVVVDEHEQDLAARLCRHLQIPVLGIGRAPGCHGQIFVTDALCQNDGFGPLQDHAAQRLAYYARQLRSGAYPVPHLRRKSRVAAAAPQFTVA
jgi:3-methyl-2-oxobutanoate hydroxymethyltransferase